MERESSEMFLGRRRSESEIQNLTHIIQKLTWYCNSFIRCLDLQHSCLSFCSVFSRTFIQVQSGNTIDSLRRGVTYGRIPSGIKQNPIQALDILKFQIPSCGLLTQKCSPALGSTTYRPSSFHQAGSGAGQEGLPCTSRRGT